MIFHTYTKIKQQERERERERYGGKKAGRRGIYVSEFRDSLLQLNFQEWN